VQHLALSSGDAFSTVSIKRHRRARRRLLVRSRSALPVFGYWALVAGALTVPAMVAIGAWVQLPLDSGFASPRARDR